MQNVAPQQQVNAQAQAELKAVLGNMQQQLNALQQRNEQLQRDMQAAPKHVELHPIVRDAIPGHLQLQPFDSAKRKRIIARYPKSDDLPGAITDDNGLASKAISCPIGRRTVTQELPQLQRDALDVLRMAATGWHQAIQNNDNAQRAEFLMEVIRDIAVISCDNAQRMAERQLRQAFELARAKGARAVIDLADNSTDIDHKDTSLFQQAHVEAIQQIRKFNSAVEPKGRDNRSNRHGRGNGGRGGGRGGYQRNGGRGGRSGFQGNGNRPHFGVRQTYNNSQNNYRAADSNMQG